MPSSPVYEEFPVPSSLQNSVRRILRCEVTAHEQITIPARPTGYSYVGWLAKGKGTATANGTIFSISEGETHISGQLSTFDATYTLHGPCVQFLAECTADGLYQFLQEDIGTLRNKVQICAGPAQTTSDDTSTFVALLDAFQSVAGRSDPTVAAAAKRIETANGDVLVSDLIAEFATTDRQFHRQFTKIVGLPPRSFISIRRVLYALQLMSADPGQSVADIAAASNFYDQAHLTRAFKQYLRSTPARVEFDSDGTLRSIVAQS